MIYERLELNVDVARLRSFFLEHVVELPPVMRGPSFGGWSVLSARGSYRDGWFVGHKYFKQVDGQDVFDEALAKQMGFVPAWEHIRPTEICTGYLREIISGLHRMRLNPCRARISLLAPQGQSDWHRDGPADKYAVRLHIPIITNEQCTFECEEGAAHFPADGAAYVIRVNRMHQIFNRSDEYRYHLMMDIYDTAGVTKFHGKV